MAELQFKDTAAAGYDQAVGNLTRQLIPTLLRLARLGPGQRILDIASGTGLAAEAAAGIAGPSGHVVAADISPAMIEVARERLGGFANLSFTVENGGSMTFPDGSFDAVICNMGLMYFPDPARGLAEMRRVLRPRGSAAVSVNTTPARSMMSRVLVVIDRHLPAVGNRAGPACFDGSEARLRLLFETAGFREVETTTETRSMSFPSFDAYFGGVERGAGNVGQEYMSLPDEIRHAVREETRREIGDAGGPVEVAVETSFVRGIR
jgi:ubiquinone/menaquinone biosynthesis C-methylase UbiE